MSWNKKGKLKTLPQYYDRVYEGQKKFEVRKNDRDYQVNDVYFLEYYNPLDANDTRPNNIPILITYVLSGGQFGIDKDHCVFGFRELTHSESINF